MNAKEVKMSRKVQSFLSAPPKTEIDGKLSDLDKLTTYEIKELLDRQFKIQSNKQFVSKLPDKGAKIAALIARLEDKLKENEETACEIFEKLSINSIDRDTVQSVEWTGKTENKQDTYLDSDDDSEPDNLLGVLAQKTMHERKVKVLKPKPSLITSADLSDSISPDQLNHVRYIMNKTEKTVSKMTTPFKPYQTTKSNVHEFHKEGFRKQGESYEVTAATPPPMKHGPVKVLSIEESIRLQTKQNKQLKEVETKHASERLMTYFSTKIGEIPGNVLTSQQYREVDSEDLQASDNELIEGSDNEVYDEEHDDRGGIVYTIMK